MDTENLKLKMQCLLRAAGLSRVRKSVLVGTGALCVALMLVAAVRFWPAGASVQSQDFETVQQGQAQQPDESSANAGDYSQAPDAETGEAAVKVDVEGAVKAPGLYMLETGARVGDAVEAAGGMKADAYRRAVNLAQKLEDGQQLYIMTKKEFDASTAGTDGLGGGASPGEPAGAGGASGAVPAAGAGEGKVNLNTADAAGLQDLPGVGPVLAASIVAYREESGGFKSVEDLKNVSGIGDTRFSRLKDLVCI